MSDDYIQIMLDEDGTAREYDGTYDFFVHCRSKEEQEEALTILSTMRWIPISERLPEDEGWYLVTDDSGGVRWLEVEHYNPKFGLEPFCTVQNPIAWMPLPEPYKDGESE